MSLTTNDSQLTTLSGFLILDKPVGITSARAVARVKYLLKPKKVGHGGTLDPLASGVLPLALNNATKLFNSIVAERKTYRFTIAWGEERDTDDAEGKVTATTDRIPTPEEINAALPAFIGKVMQTPPVYSAIKVDGHRAYDLARAGKVVELQAREVEIFELRVVSCQLPASTAFEMECGKGTYVRALARDLARKLNSLGYISALRRACVGPFHEKDAISLEKLEDLVHKNGPVESWLDGILADLTTLKT